MTSPPERAEPMQGLADYLRAQANMLRGDAERTFRRWAAEVEASRPMTPAQVTSWRPLVEWWEAGAKDWDSLQVAVRSLLSQAAVLPMSGDRVMEVMEVMELARVYAHAYYTHYTAINDGGKPDGMCVKAKDRLREAIETLVAALPPKDSSKAPSD